MTNSRQSTNSGNASYAPVNGLAMYYEIQGTGQPLLVLPGGLMTLEMMGEIIPQLAQTRQVIAVEPQTQGRTADIDRPLTHEQLADDMVALVRHLQLERVDVFGFSLGGEVALQLAIRHPEVVRRLVVISAPLRREWEYPDVRALEASFEAESPVLAMSRAEYEKVAPRRQDWPSAVTKLRELCLRDYDWSEQASAIVAPTLIVFADADLVVPAHFAEMFAAFGGGRPESAMGQPANAQLAVLPGTTHFSIMARTDLLLPMVTSFLDTPRLAAG